MVEPQSTCRAAGRVLVVDDDVAVCKAFGRVLRHAGFEVTWSLDVEGALRQVRQGERFDVILADLHMPEAMGPELYLQLAEGFPGQAAKLVYMSGDAPALQRAAEATGSATLEKPVDTGKLLALCHALCT